MAKAQEYQDAAAALRQFAQIARGASFFAEFFERFSSYEQAVDEAQARVKALEQAEFALAVQVDEARARVGEAEVEADRFLAAAQDKAAKYHAERAADAKRVLDESSAKADKMLSEARMARDKIGAELTTKSEALTALEGELARKGQELKRVEDALAEMRAKFK